MRKFDGIYIHLRERAAASVECLRMRRRKRSDLIRRPSISMLRYRAHLGEPGGGRTSHGDNLKCELLVVFLLLFEAHKLSHLCDDSMPL